MSTDVDVRPSFDHSAELTELAAALAAAQGEFEAVAKDSTNPFFKSRYAGLPQVVKAAAPILATHGLSVTQLPGLGDTLTTCVMHKSGQWIASTMQLRPVKNDPQAQGSAITYGRRYAYMAALGLVADEDDDGNAASASKTKALPAAPDHPRVSAATVNKLMGKVELAGLDKDTDPLKLKLNALRVPIDGGIKKTLGTLTSAQAAELDGWLNEQIDKQPVTA